VQINFTPFRTSTFRLASLFLLIFVLSILAALGYIYYNTVVLLEQQNEETIQSEVLGLSDQYRLLGLSGVVATIERREAQNANILFQLAAPNGDHIAGNLHSIAIEKLADNEWIDFQIKQEDLKGITGHTQRGFNIGMANGYHLMVAQDVEELTLFRGLIQSAFGWVLSFSLLLGLGGGFLISRNFLSRINGITQTSRVIMNGDLKERMPVSGSGDELDQLSHSLNDMLNKIELLMQGMRDVSSNVAHDLKTPLTRLRARVEDALRGENIWAQRNALEQTLHDCDNLLSTFNAVLSITQLDAGQHRANLETLDAYDTLADVVELYEPLAEENNGTIELRASPGLKVKAKRELLAQALTNLVDNAMKYGQSRTGAVHIVVSAMQDKKTTVIAVSDQGVGVPEQDRERVLGRFVRLDESRSKPGNGLGLSLVSSIATLLGGKLILADNKPGLRAELHLPFIA
jgi:signal transduction histidine kinase